MIEFLLGLLSKSALDYSQRHPSTTHNIIISVSCALLQGKGLQTTTEAQPSTTTTGKLRYMKMRAVDSHHYQRAVHYNREKPFY